MNYKERAIKVAETVERKNADYGGSYHNIREKYGHKSFLIRLADKIARYENLMDGHEAQVDESVIDTIEDIIGYCLLELDYLHEEVEDFPFVEKLWETKIKDSLSEFDFNWEDDLPEETFKLDSYLNTQTQFINFVLMNDRVDKDVGEPYSTGMYDGIFYWVHKDMTTTPDNYVSDYVLAEKDDIEEKWHRFLK